MLIERIIELQLVGPEPPGQTYTPINWLISRQNKNLNEKSLSRLLFNAKMLQETLHLTSPYLDQITYN